MESLFFAVADLVKAVLCKNEKQPNGCHPGSFVSSLKAQRLRCLQAGKLEGDKGMDAGRLEGWEA